MTSSTVVVADLAACYSEQLWLTLVLAAVLDVLTLAAADMTTVKTIGGKTIGGALQSSIMRMSSDAAHVQAVQRQTVKRTSCKTQ
jgi:hypothetical protein